MGGAIAANLTIAHSANMWVQADPNATPLSLSGLDGVTPVTLIDHGNFYTRSSTITMQDQAKLLVAANGHLDMDGGTVMKAASCCTDPDQLVNAGGHVSSFDATLDGVAYVDDGGVTEAAKGGFLSLTGGAPSSLTGTTITGRGRLTIGDPMAVAGTITSRHGQLAVVEGGDLSGEAVVDVTVDNESGLVDPGGPDGSGNVGTLTVGGRFTQRSAGTLHLDLSSTGSDQLVVVGVATLAGTVVANNLSGYAPTRGESRTVVTSAGVTWKVTCVVTGGQGSKHGHWQPVAGETDLGLTWRRGSQTSC